MTDKDKENGIKDSEKGIDDSLRLIAAFMRVKDPKARLEVIKLAERYVKFEKSESDLRRSASRATDT